MAVQCNKKNSLGWRWLQVSRGLQLGHKDLDGDELLHEAIRSLNEFGLFFFFFAKPGGLIRPTDSLHRPDPGDCCTGLALLMLLCCPSGWNRFQKHSSICLCFCPVSLRPLRPVRQLVCRRTWWSFPIPPPFNSHFLPPHVLVSTLAPSVLGDFLLTNLLRSSILFVFSFSLLCRLKTYTKIEQLF